MRRQVLCKRHVRVVRGLCGALARLQRPHAAIQHMLHYHACAHVHACVSTVLPDCTQESTSKFGLLLPLLLLAEHSCA